MAERKADIKSFSFEELEQFCKARKLPSFRAKQIFDWLHVKQVTAFSQMTNLPKTMIAQLEEEAEITAEQAEPLLNGFGESYLREQMVAGVIRSRNTSVLETKDCWFLEGEYVCVEMIGAMQREQMGEEHE